MHPHVAGALISLSRCRQELSRASSLRAEMMTDTGFEDEQRQAPETALPPALQSRALSEDELVAYELTLQAMWAY